MLVLNPGLSLIAIALYGGVRFRAVNPRAIRSGTAFALLPGIGPRCVPIRSITAKGTRDFLGP